ncbi:MAG TPA: hypothetical protein VFM53_08880 [Anaeromyxobacteraceae bacterium]|nr:hypothetical protein [Anaeromyxobacteraceae bacterium]
MSTLQSLLLLLVVAYMGGFLMGGRGDRGRGLPSGSEWLVVGIVAGPSALGLVTGAELQAFSPLALIATGWIALLVGLTFGVDGDRRIPASGVLLGLAAGGIAFALPAAAAWLLLEHVPAVGAAFPSRADRVAVVLALGASLSDTSRHVAGWAARRLGARGPLLDRVADVTRSDDLFPILGLSGLIALDPVRGLPVLPAAGMALGAVLGLACAVLLGRALRVVTFWALLFGFSLLATGAAEQLDLSVVGAGFALGLALGLASPLRADARRLAGGVEGAVVLPALFLAGARANRVPGPVLALAAGAVAARVVASVVSAGLVAAADRTTRRGGPALALSFVSTGPLGIAIALAVGLRRPGPVADAVLGAAVASSILGEFLGPPALRRALGRAGELPAAAAAGGDAPAPAEPGGGAGAAAAGGPA